MTRFACSLIHRTKFLVLSWGSKGRRRDQSRQSRRICIPVPQINPPLCSDIYSTFSGFEELSDISGWWDFHENTLSGKSCVVVQIVHTLLAVTS